MAGFSERQIAGNVIALEGDVTAIAAQANMTGIIPQFKETAFSLEFYSDEDGTTVVTPTSGTVAISCLTFGNSVFYEAAGTVDVAAYATPTYSRPLTAVRAVPSTVIGGGVTHYRVTATMSQ